MDIPEKPREIVRFLLIIFIIGLIPAFIINIISTQSYWDVLINVFTSETWAYFNWWLSVFPEPAAGFIAIYAAFALERREERKRFQQRVREIVPYIYFELLENISHIEEFLRDQNKFIGDNRQFNDSSWEMFKDDVKKWQEINVVPLSRIYFCLSYINRKIENDTLSPDDEEITKRVRIALKLINKQLEIYESNYFNYEANLDELRDVSEIYLATSLLDEDLQETTVMKVGVKDLQEIFKERIVDIIISKLVNSQSFATANIQANKLKKYQPLNNGQINEIIKGYINNDQVSGGFGSKKFIMGVYREKKDVIDPLLREQFEKML